MIFLIVCTVSSVMALLLLLLLSLLLLLLLLLLLYLKIMTVYALLAYMQSLQPRTNRPRFSLPLLLSPPLQGFQNSGHVIVRKPGAIFDFVFWILIYRIF